MRHTFSVPPNPHPQIVPTYYNDPRSTNHFPSPPSLLSTFPLPPNAGLPLPPHVEKQANPLSHPTALSRLLPPHHTRHQNNSRRNNTSRMFAPAFPPAHT